MNNDATPARLAAVQSAMAPFTRFVTDSFWRQSHGNPAANDFAFGNPNELPLAGFVSALRDSLMPDNTQWFAYKFSEPAAQEAVAQSLRTRLGLPFERDDIALTNGAYAALAVTLSAIVDDGDEVIFITPPWFFYEALIVAHGGSPVRVPMNPVTFDLDLAAIGDAITPRTRAVIVNSPNNPTGKVYPRETLAALAALLDKASARIGRTIAIVSDESYSRIVFDGRTYHSPAQCYPDTFVIYTYGKTLLTPGQRIGYIALPPAMPHRERLRRDLFTAQLIGGFAFPNALLQHALPALETLSIDVANLQHKRDRLVAALRDIGYDVHVPEGTFYLLPAAPIPDDVAFCERLAQDGVFCLPGAVVELPGYFRISLTATDEMIDRALPGFSAAWQQPRA